MRKWLEGKLWETPGASGEDNTNFFLAFFPYGVICQKIDLIFTKSKIKVFGKNNSITQKLEKNFNNIWGQI